MKTGGVVKLWTRHPAIPLHRHVWDWENAGDYAEDGLAGVHCLYEWLIPPGPRGKHPRKQKCHERIDMNEILDILKRAV